MTRDEIVEMLRIETEEEIQLGVERGEPAETISLRLAHHHHFHGLTPRGFPRLAFRVERPIASGCGGELR